MKIILTAIENLLNIISFLFEQNLTFCKAAHSQITKATLILCKADLEFKWKSSNWPRDSAGLISWVTTFTPGSQIQQQSAPNNLKGRKKKLLYKLFEVKFLLLKLTFPKKT